MTGGYGINPLEYDIKSRPPGQFNFDINIVQAVLFLSIINY